MSDKAEEPPHSITAQPPKNTKTKKSKASNSVLGKDEPSDYHKLQAQNCEELDRLCGKKGWHVEDIISQKSHPKALEALISSVKSAKSCGIDTKDFLGPDGYFRQQWGKKKQRKVTELRDVIKEAQKLMLEELDGSIQGTADQPDGTAFAKVTADLEVENGPKTNPQSPGDGADALHQDDNGTRPSSSSPTVEGSPRPRKKQKYVDLRATTPPDDDTECRRLIYYQEPALKIITRLENVKMLNDDTVSYVSRILGLVHNGDRAEILSPVRFWPDEDKVPEKANFVPQPNQNTFIPLHHRHDSHWTLCLLKLEEEVLSVYFCDSLKDKSRKDKVEELFKSWNREAYPEYQLSFHEKSTKDLERVRKELEEAENSLVIETTKREGANQALEMISNTSAVEQVDLSLADDGVAAVDELGSPERQAKQHFEVFWSGLAKTQQDTITKDKEASRLCFEQAYLNAKSGVQNLTKEKDCLLSKVKRWEKFCQIFEALSFLGHPAHDGH
ncbi:hypothetical protein FGLOB1_13711 [Fusarium globosum]|uniref:Uncharacterized protein n=1 Tax=Fusarium globosum TaxID=78864 RepID=A0A8H5XLR4_9HYPO|nr:hypothetical protein FGLOB1_13711 [Fusarium globosum]